MVGKLLETLCLQQGRQCVASFFFSFLLDFNQLLLFLF